MADAACEPDLTHHGDRELAAGMVDLAVNVRGPAPQWLRERLVAAVADLAAYPDVTAATAAVARRHGRPPEEVLVTAGGAEAFTLLARALRPGIDVRHAVVVHPQFTEPEVALRTAGHAVRRVLLGPADGFRLDPHAVPDEADLVVLGNPTNPTSVLHPADVVHRLLRPGRTVVVDEAFMDAVPGERESMAAMAGTPGLVVVRSLTKTWGLAGLRAGYLLGDADLVSRCRAVQPPWSVSSLAAVAAVACSEPRAVDEAARSAARTAQQRGYLVERLAALGLHAVQPAVAPFVLVPVPDGLQGATGAAGQGVLRFVDATPSRGSAPTGCASPSATKRPPTTSPTHWSTCEPPAVRRPRPCRRAPGDRRAAGRAARLPARRDRRRGARTRPRRGPPRAQRRAEPALGLPGDPRTRPARAGGRARAGAAPGLRADAAAGPGQGLRGAEDRGHPRHPGQHRGHLRPHPRRSAHPRPAHPAADRRVQRGPGGAEPLVGGACRGPRRRLGQLRRRGELAVELGLPEHLDVVAYLCVGYVDEFVRHPSWRCTAGRGNGRWPGPCTRSPTADEQHEERQCP